MVLSLPMNNCRINKFAHNILNIAHNIKILAHNKINIAHNKIKLHFGVISALLLLSGMLIYLLFRSFDNMVLFAWMPKPAFLETVLIPLKPSIFSNFLRYYLPDILWFLSGILFLRFIWFDRIKIQKAYLWCFYGVGLVIEICQLSDNVPGTFDWLDLFFMFIAAFTESLVYKKFFLRRNV